MRQRAEQWFDGARGAGQYLPRYLKPSCAYIEGGFCEKRKDFIEDSSHAEIYVETPGYQELLDAFEQKFVADGVLLTYRGQPVFAGSALPSRPSTKIANASGGFIFKYIEQGEVCTAYCDYSSEGERFYND